MLDLAGLGAIAGTLYFAYRRYLRRPDQVENRREDLTILALFLLILLGGFLEEGARIAVTQPSFEVWSPVGWVLARACSGWTGASCWRCTGPTGGSTCFAFAFLGYVGYSKLLHIVTGPFNLFWRSPEPPGALASIANIEEAESYGVSAAREFNWKQLLDGDACTRCGRCQANCPASATAKPLSPRKLILDVRDALESDAAEETPPALIGGRIGEDEIWDCTTCRSCEEHCPVGIEHVAKVVDLRRTSSLTKAASPRRPQLPLP